MKRIKKHEKKILKKKTPLASVTQAWIDPQCGCVKYRRSGLAVVAPGYLGVWNSAKIPPAGLLPTKARSAGCSEGMDGRKSGSVLRGVWGRLATLFYFFLPFFPFFSFFSLSRGEERTADQIMLIQYAETRRGWVCGGIENILFCPPPRVDGHTCTCTCT